MVFGVSPGFLTFALFVWFMGLISLPIIGAVFGPIMPQKMRHAVGGIWAKLMMISYDRAMLVLRRDGSYDILPSEYDPESESELVYIDGEPRDFTDSHGLMGSLARRKLGIAIEDVSAVLNPAVVAVAQAQKKKLSTDGGTVDAKPPEAHDADLEHHIERVQAFLEQNTVEDIAESALESGGILRAYWDTDVDIATPDDGESDDELRGQWVTAMNPFTRLKGSDVVVDMREIYSILEGSSDSEMAQRVNKRVLASQQKKVGPSSWVRYGVPGGALILGWVMRDLSAAGGGGGSVIPIPGMIGFVPTTITPKLIDVLVSAAGVVV